MTKHTEKKYKTKKEFWSDVDIQGPLECWPWTKTPKGGGKRSTTYGNLKFRNKRESAHRVAWILERGEIPDGLVVMHQCDNGLCCNPEHLVLGSQGANMREKVMRGRHSRRYGSTNLMVSEVLRIREIYANGEMNQAELGEKFGVSQVCISMVVNRKTWAWL